MSPEKIRLVRQSFAQVTLVADQAAALFYAKLFARDPAISNLFLSADMAMQGRKLLNMIGDAVRLMDRPERLEPVLRALGKRHVAYGVRDTHYGIMGAALLETLADALGRDFTPAIGEAWTALYAYVARTMRMGAAEM
ncbi:MAG: hemin receptor [Acidovorax sp.]|nr:hemin receptor [Acidovorax sp.]